MGVYVWSFRMNYSSRTWLLISSTIAYRNIVLRKDVARIIQEGISLSLSLSIFAVLFIVNLFDNSKLSIDSSLYKAIHIYRLFGFAESKRESQVSTKRQEWSFELRQTVL